ncbi:MAG: signal peptidase II [Candidatus Aminicenantales bacterium]
MRRTVFYYLLIVFLLLVDQVTKFAVTKYIRLYQDITIIPGFMNLTNIHNRGAIFGFFSQNHNPAVYIILTIASLLALGFVVYFFFKTPFSDRMMKVSLSFILAGAMGNLLDRVLKGYVVDFIDVYVKSWHWPTFNLADASISIGAVLLVSFLLFGRPKCSPSS